MVREPGSFGIGEKNWIVLPYNQSPVQFIKISFPHFNLKINKPKLSSVYPVPVRKPPVKPYGSGMWK